MGKRPFFSIVTVSYKDAWALTKTARSVFCQAFEDFEYIVIDGNSEDGTAELIEFWTQAGLIDRSLIEPDHGVYHAMNKGICLAQGEYVCFMNAGDQFANDNVLSEVAKRLSGGQLDGCLGWGELNGQVWASWSESQAFKLSSLGFCHQALYVRRDRLIANRFDDRVFKTDSDTLQLGRFYEQGCRIEVVPEIWAVRGGEPGISADLDRTRFSIHETLLKEYRGLKDSDAEDIIAFRRGGERAEAIERLMEESTDPLRSHLACLCLDTAFQRQSRQVKPEALKRIVHKAMAIVEESEDVGGTTAVERLISTQESRAAILSERKVDDEKLLADIGLFARQETSRISRLQLAPHEFLRGQHEDYVVSLTSFPARIRTLPFVMRALVEQTCPPSEIHLYLGKDEIPNRRWLPKALLELEERGLTVHFVEKTCHQYDKFLHDAELNSDRPYVIVDDDVIYHPHSMAMLLEGLDQHSGCVIANRCHMMEVGLDGALAPYSIWKREQRAEKPAFRLMPTGAGGVLYPAGFLTRTPVANVREVLRHAPYADDIWLKACALAAGIPTFATELSSGSLWYHRYTPTMRAGTLMATNVERGLNDLQMSRCADWLDTDYAGWRERLVAEMVGVPAT